MGPLQGPAAERAWVCLAGLAGVVHAGFSLYWALGGQWLLATVGQWAVDLRSDAPVATTVGLLAVFAVKLSVAVIPVAVAYGKLPWRQFWRALSWCAGLVLMAYGGLNTAVAIAVLTGVVSPDGGYDTTAMVGHAYLWDPLFLLWGSALVLSLWVSRGHPESAATRRDGTRLAREG